MKFCDIKFCIKFVQNLWKASWIKGKTGRNEKCLKNSIQTLLLSSVKRSDGRLCGVCPSFTVPLLSTERGGRWRGILKSITVPSGMFVSLAGFILFMKRYPHCSLSQIIAGLRTNRTPQAHHQSANIQVSCRCSRRRFFQFGLEF